MTILEILQNKQLRIKYFETDLMLFILYHFWESVWYPFSKYHKMYIKSLAMRKHVFNKTFRKRWATVILKYFIIWCIVYRKFKYIVFYSADRKSSSAKLFDIGMQLQTNKRLIEDYWQLYFDEDYGKQSKKKTQNLFITENNVKVESMSIKSSLRWSIYGIPWEWEFRPDLVVFDDIDTNLNTKSVSIITDNFRMLTEEIIWAMWDDPQVVFLWNTIRSDWVVPRVEKEFSERDQYIIPIFEKKTGKLTRPERYTRTNEEWKESVQKLRKQYTKTARITNFLLESYDWENMIDRSRIQYTNKYPKRFDRICIWDDPAISLKTKSDRHALVVVGRKWDDYYVLDSIVFKGKEKSQQNTIKATHNLYKKRKANAINFESVWFQSRDADELKKLWCAVNLIKPHRDKITRMRNILEYPLEKWHVYFLPDAEAVARELLTFPNWDHDDAVDALVYAMLWSRWRRSSNVILVDTYI